MKTPKQQHHQILLDGFHPIYKGFVENLQKKYPDQVTAHEYIKKHPQEAAKDMELFLKGSRMMYFLSHQSGTSEQMKKIEAKKKLLTSKDDYVELFKQAIQHGK